MLVSDGKHGRHKGSQVRHVHLDQWRVLRDHLQRADQGPQEQPPAGQPIGDPVSTQPVHKMTVDNTPLPLTINGYS
jgi:hypothetical protein